MLRLAVACGERPAAPRQRLTGWRCHVVAVVAAERACGTAGANRRPAIRRGMNFSTKAGAHYGLRPQSAVGAHQAHTAETERPHSTPSCLRLTLPSVPMHPPPLARAVVLIGDSGVGKSNLLSRFTKNEFNLEVSC